MSPARNLLIIACSGRMLAQFAAYAGYIPLVIDCYADDDTKAVAGKCIKVQSLAIEPVKNALSLLAKKFTFTHFVYGSGLERFADTLAYLQQQLMVVGNSVQVFSTVQQKKDFFSFLNKQGISYPESTFSCPVHSEGWLIKPLQGEGGVNIKSYQHNIAVADGFYWQKHQSGTPMSVLFIANGIDFEIIGFNKQFVTSIEDHDFVFAGLLSQPEADAFMRQTLRLWIAALVSEYHLIGVNSLDFIADNGHFYMLEINARMSASMQLYSKQLFENHIEACINHQLITPPVVKKYQGYKILYAVKTVYIEDAIIWTEWCADIPQTGSFIHTGQPICSIIASEKNEQRLQDLLLLRERIILENLNR